ncbi:tetratricopeptide repeat protein [Aquisalinus flavus]|uniref:Tetratricopeptide repeat protein n=1 Tax=Aquisalinus flavus TaxID=1526572 RepID=A0A8J2Y5X7_9PROT|nr:hypothetical protein [Aquisalinus flavus]MBD0425220.1 hypothetical protein [Aquisalinus flavus]UNE49119.1 hypothetical protein FF099_14195 [Aquisalinus flavus]GGD17771.1 hypothetical protein GCM10011342_28250 [Aquisalinus flavus]
MSILALILAAALSSQTATAPATVPGDGPVVYDNFPGQGLDPRYGECVAALETDPEAGRAAALRWVTDGGGAPAVHCAALADLAMDLPRVGARRLYALAEDLRADDPGMAARLYAQSAQAWLAGDEPEKALIPLEKAYGIAPRSPELHLMAAPVYAGAERWGQTKRVLDLLESEHRLNANGYTLRAKAKQMLADYEGAAADIRIALNREPENIDALIIRGELIQAGYEIDPWGAPE